MGEDHTYYLTPYVSTPTRGHDDASDPWVSMSTWTLCPTVLKKGPGRPLSPVHDR